MDDLDEIRAVDQEHMISFLLNLVSNVNEINMKIQKVSKRSKCILLLRSDIISLFSSRSSNNQKIISDCNVELNWFGPESRNELSQMIMHKIKKSTPTKYFSEMSYSEMKIALFPKSNDTDGIKYILNHSFGRPRDVITYLNTIISNFPNEEKFSMQIVKAAELEYSNNFLKELKNEMSLTLEPDTIQDIEMLFRTFGKRNFRYEDIIAYYKMNLSLYPNINDFDSLLQYLYKLGAIGTYKKKKNSRHYTWSYRRNGGELLDKDGLITIHAGLYKALNI